MNAKRLFLLPTVAIAAGLLVAGNDRPAPPMADAATVDLFLERIAERQALREEAARESEPDVVEMAAKADRHQGLVRGIPAALR